MLKSRINKKRALEINSMRAFAKYKYRGLNYWHLITNITFSNAKFPGVG